MNEEQYVKLLDQVDSVLKEVEKELSSRSGEFYMSMHIHKHTNSIRIVVLVLCSINLCILSLYDVNVCKNMFAQAY